MEQNNKSFSMVRGDTENIVVSLETDGVATALVTGDTVNFTMRKTGANGLETLNGDIVLAKTITTFTNGVADIEFTNADTKDIVITGEEGYNEYVFEVEVLFADGERKTVLRGATLKIYGDLNG